MTLDWPNILGLIGSTLMVIAYAYSNLAKRIDLLLFNGLNLLGSLMLLYSLLIHVNLASLTLEIVWAFIAGVGTIRAIGRRYAA